MLVVAEGADLCRSSIQEAMPRSRPAGTERLGKDCAAEKVRFGKMPKPARWKRALPEFLR